MSQSNLLQEVKYFPEHLKPWLEDFLKRCVDDEILYQIKMKCIENLHNIMVKSIYCYEHDEDVTNFSIYMCAEYSLDVLNQLNDEFRRETMCFKELPSTKRSEELFNPIEQAEKLKSVMPESFVTENVSEHRKLSEQIIERALLKNMHNKYNKWSYGDEIEIFISRNNGKYSLRKGEIYVINLGSSTATTSSTILPIFFQYENKKKPIIYNCEIMAGNIFIQPVPYGIYAIYDVGGFYQQTERYFNITLKLKLIGLNRIPLVFELNPEEMGEQVVDLNPFFVLDKDYNSITELRFGTPLIARYDMDLDDFRYIIFKNKLQEKEEFNFLHPLTLHDLEINAYKFSNKLNNSDNAKTFWNEFILPLYSNVQKKMLKNTINDLHSDIVSIKNGPDVSYETYKLKSKYLNKTPNIDIFPEDIITPSSDIPNMDTVVNETYKIPSKVFIELAIHQNFPNCIGWLYSNNLTMLMDSHFYLSLPPGLIFIFKLYKPITSTPNGFLPSFMKVPHGKEMTPFFYNCIIRNNNNEAIKPIENGIYAIVDINGNILFDKNNVIKLNIICKLIGIEKPLRLSDVDPEDMSELWTDESEPIQMLSVESPTVIQFNNRDI